MKIYCLTGEVVNIEGNKLEGNNLIGLELHRALFSFIKMKGINIDSCNLRSAEFYYVDLSKSLLKDNLMMNIIINFSCLIDTDLRKSKLIGSQIYYCNLENSNLEGADVSHSSFNYCNLCGANMRCLRMDELNLKGSIYNDSTLWSEGFEPEKHGAIKIKSELTHVAIEK